EVATEDGDALLGSLGDRNLFAFFGLPRRGEVRVDRVAEGEEAQADHRHQPRFGEALRRERLQQLRSQQRLTLDAGAVEDLGDRPLESGKVDEEVGPVDAVRPAAVVALGPGLVQKARKALAQAVQGVAARGVTLEVLEGEAIENFVAEGALEHRKAAAQAFQEAGIVGVGVDGKTLGRCQVARAPDDRLQLAAVQADQTLRLLGAGAAFNAAGMGDHRLEPALDHVQRARSAPCLAHSTSGRMWWSGWNTVAPAATRPGSSVTAGSGSGRFSPMNCLALSTSSCTTGKGGMLASHSSRVETPPVSWWAVR